MRTRILAAALLTASAIAACLATAPSVPPRAPIDDFVYRGDLPGLERALAAGADPNRRFERADRRGYVRGKPALVNLAASSGHLPLVQRLVSAGARTEPASDGEPTLHAALGQIEVLRWLLAEGANVSGPAGARAIVAATSPNARPAALTALLLAGADPAPHLTSAVTARSPAALAGLLDFGADPREPDATGLTPWQAFAERERRALSPNARDEARSFVARESELWIVRSMRRLLEEADRRRDEPTPTTWARRRLLEANLDWGEVAYVDIEFVLGEPERAHELASPFFRAGARAKDRNRGYVALAFAARSVGPGPLRQRLVADLLEHMTHEPTADTVGIPELLTRFQPDDFDDRTRQALAVLLSDPPPGLGRARMNLLLGITDVPGSREALRAQAFDATGDCQQRGRRGRHALAALARLGDDAALRCLIEGNAATRPVSRPQESYELLAYTRRADAVRSLRRELGENTPTPIFIDTFDGGATWPGPPVAFGALGALANLGLEGFPLAPDPSRALSLRYERSLLPLAKAWLDDESHWLRQLADAS